MAAPEVEHDTAAGPDTQGVTGGFTYSYSREEAGRLFGPRTISMSYLLDTYRLSDDILDHHELVDHHKQDHFGRVLVLSILLSYKLVRNGNIMSETDLESSRWFAVLHDAFLTADNYDRHGIEAAQYITDDTRSIVPVALRPAVALAVLQHVPDDPPGGLPFLSRFVKDIDALDRGRLPNGEEKLKPSYLRFAESRELIPLAERLFEQSQEYMAQGEEPFYAALHAGKELGILSE